MGSAGLYFYSMRQGFIVCFLAMACACSLSAQATSTIHGTVYDPSGAVVPDAAVTATNVNTSLTRQFNADASGQFTIPLLPIGEYRVRVEKAGFTTFIQSGIRLQVNTNVEVNAKLEPRSTTEQITVTADAGLVQTATSSLVQVIDEKRVTELPLNGRNVLQLISLNSGIADRGSSGGTHSGEYFGRQPVSESGFNQRFARECH